MRNHIVICRDPSPEGDDADCYTQGVLVYREGRTRFTYEEAKACVDEMRAFFPHPTTYTITLISEVAG